MRGLPYIEKQVIPQWICDLAREKRELDEKINKLDKELTSEEDYDRFTSMESSLAFDQLRTMKAYGSAVAKRMRYWRDTT